MGDTIVESSISQVEELWMSLQEETESLCPQYRLDVPRVFHPSQQQLLRENQELGPLSWWAFCHLQRQPHRLQTYPKFSWHIFRY